MGGVIDDEYSFLAFGVSGVYRYDMFSCAVISAMQGIVPTLSQHDYTVHTLLRLLTTAVPPYSHEHDAFRTAACSHHHTAAAVTLLHSYTAVTHLAP